MPMFESIKSGCKLSKEQYTSEVPALRSGLLQAHFALKTTRIPVVIIVSGADAAGKGQFVQRLNEWLDPRGVDTYAFWERSDEERDRPPRWRFWRALPARGRVGIFFGSWYTEPIVQRVYGELKKRDFEAVLRGIAFLENMLALDGAVIIKLWFHLSKKAQREHLDRLEKNPETRFRVQPSDWKHFKLYDEFIKASELVVRQTHAPHAPWHLIDAADRRYRELTAGRIVLKSIEQALSAGEGIELRMAKGGKAKSYVAGRPGDILRKVNLQRTLSAEREKDQLAALQNELGGLARKANARKIANVVVFEGWDAAGKGGAIRRVTQAIDPRLYRVVSIAAPTAEEKAHHYLWRFWRHLPRAGMTTFYDRSWYGRVLVERVEGFAREDEWRRAYEEINDFEAQLTASRVVVTKFWIHISKDEQLRRFKEREKVTFKQYKITDEDWRNREKWEAYERAVNDMVARTSTKSAPWSIIAGNDKRFARVEVLKILCRNLAKALE